MKVGTQYAFKDYKSLVCCYFIILTLIVHINCTLLIVKRHPSERESQNKFK